MLEHEELTLDEQAEVVALEKKLQESEAFVQELLGRGWIRGGDRNMVICLGDEKLNVWRDPYSGELLLSPRLCERLKYDTGLGQGFRGR